jgi:serine O-acetyltransferase
MASPEMSKMAALDGMPSGASQAHSALWQVERLTWRETRSRIKADHARLIQLLSAREHPMKTAYTHPSFICVFLYRIANHCFRGQHWLLARLFWQLNFLFTGADVSQLADLGPGLVILGPAGVAMMGKAGKNLTMMPISGIGGEVGREEDIGAGPGLPILGDDVIMEPHTGILGPVRIGNRVRVSAGSVITRDIPDDTIVTSPKARFIRRSDLS